MNIVIKEVAIRTTIILILIISSSIAGCSLKQEVPPIQSLLDVFAEADERTNFVVRAVTSMEKLLPSSCKKEWIKSDLNDQIELFCGGNECESFQIALIPFKELTNITWSFSGDIDRKMVSISPVGYVNVPKPMNHDSVKNYPDEDDMPGLWPDPIYSTRKKIERIPAHRIQSLWVTFNIPTDFKPGTYNIKIDVNADSSIPVSVKVTLHIWDFSLPERAHLRTCFYFQDYLIPKYYPEIKGEDLLNLKKQYWKMTLDHRINPINLQLFNDIGITYDQVTKKYSFDITRDCKERLKFLLEDNDKKANLITVTNGRFDDGSPGAFKNPLPGVKNGFLDFTGEKIFSNDYENFLIQHLETWREFLEENGWAKYGSMLFVDEPVEKNWKAIKHLCPIVRKVAPEWPIYGAVNFQPSAVVLQNDLDIMAPGLGSNFNSVNLPFYENLVRQGREVWAYICFKGSCINFQSLDHRMQIWICWNYGLKGYLYWGTVNWFQRNSLGKYPGFYGKIPEKRWPNSPNSEWKHTSFDIAAPGDGYLIYPSPEGPPWSSIRLENYRDGIEDYDYFCILQEMIGNLEKASSAHKQLIKQARILLNLQDSFVKSPNVYSRDIHKMLERRKQIGEMIVEVKMKLEQYAERSNRGTL
ncbi:MAG: DUF4091 domain-containing protein [Desulfobacteraceae bacterium]|nr:MAG: DUF4091 domain-containing protein [Desulfobacteraceae bacterium]